MIQQYQLIGMSPSTSGYFLPFPAHSQDPIKKYALLYSKIAIADLDSVLKGMEDFKWTRWEKKQRMLKMAELEWLAEKGVIFDPKLDPSFKTTDETSAYARRIGELRADMLRNFYGTGNAMKDESQELYEYFFGKMHASARLRDDYLARVLSVTFNAQNRTQQSVPIVFYFEDVLEDSTSKKAEVLNMVLERMPALDSDTPWEAILDFRTDRDSTDKLVRLRHWTSEMVRSNLGPKEIAEELEYLLSEYEAALRLHKLEFHRSRFEWFILAAAEIAENLLKLKFSKLAESVFRARQLKRNLLSAEDSSSGRELAFIIHARDHFDTDR